MKAHLIIVNWLFSLLLLTYAGENVIVTAIILLWFFLACVLLNTNRKAVYRKLLKMNRYIDSKLS